MVVQAAVRRLNDPLAVRLLDVGALQAALQTLTASRQLASYNKLQGSIVRDALKQRAAASGGSKTSNAPDGSQQGQPKASQADYIQGRPPDKSGICAAAWVPVTLHS